jgi:protein CpxP
MPHSNVIPSYIETLRRSIFNILMDRITNRRVEFKDERRRTMKRNIIIGPLFVAALACGVHTATAESAAETGQDVTGRKLHDGHEFVNEMPRERSLAIMAKVLRLSTAQQARIRDILKAERDEKTSLLKKLSENRKQFRQKTHAATFDEAAVRTLAEKQAQLMTKMIVSSAITRNKIRALLTPEQRDLDERIQPLLERRQEHRSPSRGGEPPPFLARGPEYQSYFPDEEFPQLMKKGPGNLPAGFDED